MTATTYNVSLAAGLALTAAGVGALAGAAWAAIVAGAMLCALTLATAHLTRPR